MDEAPVPAPASGASRGPGDRWLAFGRSIALLAIGAAMARLTWRAWPDPLIDFGREVYVAWRLAEGDVLFRDVAYFNGPLSPCFNASVLRLFGTGLTTLCLVNLALVGVATVLLDRLLRDVAGSWSAFAGCALFLSVFAFGQYTAAGSYNWVAPYSHELTHGLLLSFAALLAMRYPTPRASLWTGVLIGLTFLTKAEVFAALGLAVAFGFLTRPPGARHWALLTLGFGTPLALALVLLTPALGAMGALEGTIGSWAHVFGTGVASSPFYRAMAGLDAPLENARAMAFAALAYAGLIGLAWGASRVRGERSLVCWSVFLATCFATWSARDAIPWLRAARPWPAFAALAFVLTLRSRRTLPVRPTFALFALALLGKIALATGVQLYGFALALPATMVLVAAVVDWIPQRLERRGSNGAAFRALGLGALTVAAAMHVSITARRMESKTVHIGQGADAFRCDVRGRFLKRGLRALGAPAPSATLVVLPEGAMLNYLARRRNPTPYPNFMPPELLFFGEERILDALRTTPPDAVVLVHKDTSEYGPRFFGQDYGAPIMAWVRRAYTSAALIGAPPLASEQFGVEVLVRK